jgi:hypothetical protein
MKEQNENALWYSIMENPEVSKYIKIGLIVASAAAGIYLLGHIFKISAHTVRGFKELKSALTND